MKRIDFKVNQAYWVKINSGAPYAVRICALIDGTDLVVYNRWFGRIADFYWHYAVESKDNLAGRIKLAKRDLKRRGKK